MLLWPFYCLLSFRKQKLCAVAKHVCYSSNPSHGLLRAIMHAPTPIKKHLKHFSSNDRVDRYLSTEVESRTQGSRPRTQKNSEAKAKDSLSEDRHSRGQGQECSRPRPRTKDTKRKCSPKKKKKRSPQKFFRRSKKKKKRSSQKFFRRSPLKNVFQKIFQALHKILTFQKIVLSSSRGQANFRGLEASRPRPRTSKCVLEDSTSVYQSEF